ncbi:MAG TPA: hypothetical protein VEP90_04405, partial [Methylomirabilota bacterium]|nr:hypothetical protein [Methylomirabilota bacterium]
LKTKMIVLSFNTSDKSFSVKVQFTSKREAFAFCERKFKDETENRFQEKLKAFKSHMVGFL